MNLYLDKITEAIVNMDEDNIISLIDEALSGGISAEDIYNKGLSK